MAKKDKREFEPNWREPHRRGLLIVFEGLDGAGKTTQVKKLAKYLTDEGHSVVVTNWNSGKYISRAIRRAKKAHLLTPNSFSALHAADFFNRMENIILPSLSAGKIVIADRYSYTALARDKARGIDSEWVKRIYSLAVEPDIAFLCKIPVDIALTRSMKKNRNIPKYYESGMDVSGESDPVESFREFQGNVGKAYDELVEKNILTPMDMEREVDEIFKSIVEKVNPLLEKLPKNNNFLPPPPPPPPFGSCCFLGRTEESGNKDYAFISKLRKHDFPGKLIVIEGAHHAGVTHQVNALYDWLHVRGIDVVKSGIGETWITTEIMDKASPNNALSPRTNVMLSASELSYLLEIEVLPALKRGAIVLLNRYFLTTLVCGLLRGMDRDWLIETLKGFGIRPDLTIYIDTPFEVLLERIDFTGLLEAESMYAGLDIGFTRDVETSYDFYQRNALSAYRDVVNADGLPKVDGSREPKELYETISNFVCEAIGIEQDKLPVDETLKEVLELYHKHNSYFEHAQTVREFAVQIFDATRYIHALGDRARKLLEYSALLHDVGRSVGADHEKQSYRIIMDHKFSRLKRREKRIVALLALYHNGSMENLNDSRQWKLHAEEQLAVRRLAGILRVADALDSSDRQVISRLRLSREMGAIIVDINSVGDAKEERKAVLEKKDLFEQQFGINLLIDRNRAERIKTKGKNSGESLFG